MRRARDVLWRRTAEALTFPVAGVFAELYIQAVCDIFAAKYNIIIKYFIRLRIDA